VLYNYYYFSIVISLIIMGVWISFRRFLRDVVTNITCIEFQWQLLYLRVLYIRFHMYLVYMIFDGHINDIFVIASKMSTFLPTKQHLQEILLHCLLLRKISWKLSFAWRCMGSMLHPKELDFNALKVMISIKNKEREFTPKN